MTGVSEGWACRAYTQYRISALPQLGYQGAIDLQQAPEEGDIVRPFLLRSVPEGKRSFDAKRISPEAFVFLIQS